MLVAPGRPGRRGHRRPSRATTTPGRSSAPSRSSGPSATTTSSWSRAGPTASQGPEAAASAQAALQLALSTLLRLFAPFLPYVTEEVWSWWQEGSVHRSSWPDADELRELAGEGDPLVAEVAAGVLGEVRKAKTEAKRSLKTAVDRVVVTDTAARLAALGTAVLDVHDAGIIGEVDLAELADGAEPSVEVILADPEPEA